MSYKDLARDGVIIGFTQVIISLANIALLPVITKTLGSADFGLWIQATLTIGLISSVVLIGQGNSVLRFLDVRKDTKERSREYFSALAPVAAIALAAVAIMIALAGVLASYVFADHDLTALFIVTALFIPFPTFIAINNAFIRAAGQVRTFAVLNILNSFGLIGMIALFILNDMGVVGALVGALIISSLTFLVGFLIIVRQVGLAAPDRVIMRRNITFGLPLTPNTIIQWITSSSDRYLLAIFMGMSMVGIYSAAYNIGNVTFLLVAPIQMILYPALARLYDENRLAEVKEYTQRSLRYYLMITIPAVAGLSALATPILVTMTTPEFAAGGLVIPFIAISGLLMGMFKFYENVLHLVKRTNLNLVTFGIPAVADIVLVVLLTPILGIVGTALASALAYALMLALGIFLSRQFMRFPVDWPFLFKCVVSAGVMVGAIVLIDAHDLSTILLAILVGIPIYITVLFLMKGLTREEIGMACDMLHGQLMKGRTKPPSLTEKEMKG